MYDTLIQNINGTQVRSRTYCYNTKMVRDTAGRLVPKRFMRTVYAVFARCNPDDTTSFPDLTRFFTSKVEAIKYAKSL